MSGWIVAADACVVGRAFRPAMTPSGVISRAPARQEVSNGPLNAGPKPGGSPKGLTPLRDVGALDAAAAPGNPRQS